MDVLTYCNACGLSYFDEAGSEFQPIRFGSGHGHSAASTVGPWT